MKVHFCRTDIFTFSELVVFMVSISELRLFQIYARRNKIPFCLMLLFLEGVSIAICNVPLYLLAEEVASSFEYGGIVPL